MKRSFVIYGFMIVLSVVLSACSRGAEPGDSDSALTEKETVRGDTRTSADAEKDGSREEVQVNSDAESGSGNRPGELSPEERKEEGTMQEQVQLGGMSPEDALEYMKNTPDLVIVQVNTAEWKIEPGFKDALWIPHDEMGERYDEIPEGKPVLLHCGGGIVSVPAYETLLEKRPDIPEIGYIAGSPHGIISKYNEWAENR